MVDTSRIPELESLLAREPGSIAFAQLAEHYRRLGRLDDAVRVCRDGLSRNHVFPAAQLTLGRALLALGHADEARVELLRIVRESPDNFAAARAVDALRTLGVDMPMPSTDEEFVADLEAWLAVIVAERAGRASVSS